MTKIIWVRYLATSQAAGTSASIRREPYPFLWHEDVSVGSYVVVPSQRPYSVGVVTEQPTDREIHESLKLKWMVDVIDTKEYEDRIAREARQDEILVQLKRRADKVTVLARYEEIAKTDPEAKALMLELQSLQA